MFILTAVRGHILNGQSARGGNNLYFEIELLFNCSYIVNIHISFNVL